MPTTDKIPCATLPAFRGKGGKKILFFPAEQWEGWGCPGEFRVMRGDAWVRRPAERVSFFDIRAVTAIVMAEVADALGVAIPMDAPPPPDLPKGTRGTVWLGDGDDERRRSVTTCSHVFQLAESREWAVQVYGYGVSRCTVLCRDFARSA
ncbi:MAG: hypothetical protein AB7E47_02265 [Desulfovibrionaceae bacterium]